jgi:hypothetical protein
VEVEDTANAAAGVEQPTIDEQALSPGNDLTNHDRSDSDTTPPAKEGDFFNANGSRWYRSWSTRKTTRIALLEEQSDDVQSELSKWHFVNGTWYITTRPGDRLVRMPRTLRDELNVRNSTDSLPPIGREVDPTQAVSGALADAVDATQRPTSRSDDSGVLFRIYGRDAPKDPKLKHHVKTWWNSWKASPTARQLSSMTKDEKADAFVTWLNGQMKASRPPPKFKVQVIHEVSYKFQLENQTALHPRHLDKVRRPQSYVDDDVRFFNEATGYLGYVTRII